MIGPLTYLDAGFIALAIISGLLALYRGLSREILAVLSWIAAALTALYFLYRQEGLAADIAQQMGVELIIAKIVLCSVSALIVLVIVHLITSRISDSILDSQIGMIDRILGLVFGLLRALVLIVIPYMFYAEFIPDENEHLPWIKNAKSLPLIKSTGQSIRAFFETTLVPILKVDEQPEEGAQNSVHVQRFALACEPKVYISVTWRSRYESHLA